MSHDINVPLIKTVDNSKQLIAGPKGISEKTWKIAKQFESLFASMLLKSMRNTVVDSGLLDNSIVSSIYKDMLDTEYAQKIANTTSLGLAEPLSRQIQEIETRNKIPSPLENFKLHALRENPALSASRKSNGPIDSRPMSLDSIREWMPLIKKASKKYGIDPTLIAAMIKQESDGNRFAVSVAGAKGLMQLIDTTARQLGVRNSFDPHENIDAGTRYFGMMLQKFNKNETLALAAYNAGPASVEKYKKIPPFRETQMYVNRVLEMRTIIRDTLSIGH